MDIDHHSTSPIQNPYILHNFVEIEIARQGTDSGVKKGKGKMVGKNRAK